MADTGPTDGTEAPMVASSTAVSARMSRHPRKDTKLEMAVRRALHRHGLRYRVHLPVPGRARRTMDIAFPRHKVAVFLDGCFWHGCPEHGTIPKSNTAWWMAKLNRTHHRDQDTATALAVMGWRVMRFWAHEPHEAVVRAIVDTLHDGTGPTDVAKPRS